LESYINALLALHLFERLPPWLKTDYDRAERREKIFATDTGFMAGLLQWRLDDVLLDADRSGKIVETFVFNELAAQVGLHDGYRSISAQPTHNGKSSCLNHENNKRG